MNEVKNSIILYYFDDLYIKIERERDYNPIGTGVLEKKKRKKKSIKINKQIVLY